MATQIDISDPRTAKAIEVLASSGQWAKVVARSGDKFYGIESQRDPNRRYLTNAFTCDCPDQQRHPESACKHRLAVRLYIATVRAHHARITKGATRRTTAWSVAHEASRH